MDLKTLNALPSITPKKNERRIGRGTGSGWGKTSGRGHKGARSRSGAKIRDYYEGGQMPLQRRFPKRGFTNAPFRTQYAILNLSDLNCFEDGTAVTPELFKKTGLIKQPLDGIKILGDGDFERKNLDITAHRFSKSAIAKLEAAGCKVTSLHTPKKRRTTKGMFERRAREEAKAGAAGKPPKGKK